MAVVWRVLGGAIIIALLLLSFRAEPADQVPSQVLREMVR